jgi:hypothetical protein
VIPVPWLLSVDGAGDRACALTVGSWISSTGFAGGEREELLRTNAYDRSRVANPAEVLICGNAGIRKDLGASSRNSGLPQRPASSRISSRRFPGEFESSWQFVRPVVKTRVTSPWEREMQVRILSREFVPV